jgi:hypothetical protein
MEFGESVALGLEVLEEGGAVDEEGLRALTEAAVKTALEQDATAELSAITLPGSVAKPALQAIATVLLESAKYNATQPEVVDALVSVWRVCMRAQGPRISVPPLAREHSLPPSPCAHSVCVRVRAPPGGERPAFEACGVRGGGGQPRA